MKKPSKPKRPSKPDTLRLGRKQVYEYLFIQDEENDSFHFIEVSQVPQWCDVDHGDGGKISAEDYDKFHDLKRLKISIDITKLNDFIKSFEGLGNSVSSSKISAKYFDDFDGVYPVLELTVTLSDTDVKSRRKINRSLRKQHETKLRKYERKMGEYKIKMLEWQCHRAKEEQKKLEKEILALKESK